MKTDPFSIYVLLFDQGHPTALHPEGVIGYSPVCMLVTLKLNSKKSQSIATVIAIIHFLG
jgi:hypothetical protein